MVVMVLQWLLDISIPLFYRDCVALQWNCNDLFRQLQLNCNCLLKKKLLNNG